jgi:hypothetical protein
MKNFDYEMQEALAAPVPAEVLAGWALIHGQDRRHYALGRRDALEGAESCAEHDWHWSYRRGYQEAVPAPQRGRQVAK